MGVGGCSRQQFIDYDGFVEKFKPRKTTDDCMTPPEVYEAVLGYVVERYGIDPEKVVRPFWPGADYTATEYPEGCAVVDNPPFSRLAEIQEFYLAHGVPFFLFCQSMTCFSGKRAFDRVNHVVCNANVTYENGAVVRTSFLTNMGDADEIAAESCPELTDRVNAAVAEIAARTAKKLPKYDYPDEVLTAAKLMWMAGHGTALKVRRGECARIAKLDAMDAAGKPGIYGGGLLLSERAAAERAAAERAAAERAAAERAAAERAAAYRWKLSDRERAMQAMLGRGL